MTGALAWQVGAVTITPVVEFAVDGIEGTAVLPDATPARVAEIDWLRPHFADPAGNINMRIQLLVVESMGRRIAVDTCVGNDKDRTSPFFDHLQTPFLDTMHAAGFPPESIDTVICTHLHVDHVGWNTRRVGNEWVPTFPDARYLFNRTEYEHWKQYGVHEDGDLHGDSVEPIVSAGLADLVEYGHRVTDEITLIGTPGHSPGHQSVRIDSGSTAIITGDLMHHPVQCARTDWRSSFDSDPQHARRTREAFLAEHADTDVLIIGTHFAPPTAGRIRRDGSAFRFSV